MFAEIYVSLGLVLAHEPWLDDHWKWLTPVFTTPIKFCPSGRNNHSKMIMAMRVLRSKQMPIGPWLEFHVPYNNAQTIYSFISIAHKYWVIASRKSADEKVSIDHMAWYSNYLNQNDIHVYVHHNVQDDSYEVLIHGGYPTTVRSYHNRCLNWTITLQRCNIQLKDVTHNRWSIWLAPCEYTTCRTHRRQVKSWFVGS